MPKPTCYLCGVKPGVERDHIPPRSFFPKTDGLQLVTVPVCKTCHDTFDQIDEEVRNYLGLVDQTSSKADGLRKEKVARGIIVNKKQREQVASSLTPIIKISKSGDVVPAALFNLPTEMVKQFMVRTAKGLLYRHAKLLHFGSYEFKMCFQYCMNPEAFFTFPLPLKKYEIMPEIFKYQLGFDDEGDRKPSCFIAFLQFYHNLGFVILGAEANILNSIIREDEFNEWL